MVNLCDTCVRNPQDYKEGCDTLIERLGEKGECFAFVGSKGHAKRIERQIGIYTAYKEEFGHESKPV